jgi:hypothetical protein
MPDHRIGLALLYSRATDTIRFTKRLTLQEGSCVDIMPDHRIGLALLYSRATDAFRINTEPYFTVGLLASKISLNEERLH